MMQGAPLAGVWPPALPDALRLAVEADAGARGFSHVAAYGDDGPVILLAANALVLWSAPGELRRLSYREIEVVKRAVGGKWKLVLPAPSADPEPGAEAAAAGVAAPPAIFEVAKDMGARARECVERARLEVDPAAAQALRALEMPAARVRACVPLPVLELARPQPTERDDSASGELAHGMTGRASGVVEPSAASEANPGGPGEVPRGASDGRPLAGVVVSILDPVGYVRVQPRGVLVAAGALEPPLLVGEQVSLVARPDGTLLARAAEPRPGAQALA